jgi:hypothetical protein
VYVGGSGESSPVPIGLIGATPKPSGDRDLDHFDCGFWHVPDDAVEELGAVDFTKSGSSLKGSGAACSALIHLCVLGV